MKTTQTPSPRKWKFALVAGICSWSSACVMGPATQPIQYQPQPATTAPQQTVQVGPAQPSVDSRLAKFAEPSEKPWREMIINFTGGKMYFQASPSYMTLWATNLAMLSARCVEVGDAVAGESAPMADRPEIVCPALAKVDAAMTRNAISVGERSGASAVQSLVRTGAVRRALLDCMLYPEPCREQVRENYAPLPSVVASLNLTDFGYTPPPEFDAALKTAAARSYKKALDHRLKNRDLKTLVKEIVGLDGLHKLVATGVDLPAPQQSPNGWLRKQTVKIVVQRTGEAWCRVFSQGFVSVLTPEDTWTVWKPMRRFENGEDLPSTVPKTPADRDVVWGKWLANRDAASKVLPLSAGDDSVAIMSCK